MAPTPALHARDLSKVYRAGDVETTALAGVHLTVEAGDFVALMGPSGCGKSTLLGLLGLLDAPTSGTYALAGVDVGGLSRRQQALARRGQIGFVFQSFNLIGELTVEENVTLPLRYLGVARAEADARAEAALERVGMAHRRGHRPSQLSGGQQQRVAVARAVVAEPPLVLADEPTGNLDTENGAAVMQLLSDLHAAGTTLVMVTHSESDAAYAGRVLRMLDGRVIGEELVDRRALPLGDQHAPRMVAAA